VTAAERKQIIDQVENTSFDAPDSWDTELRVRRISLGQADGLIIEARGYSAAAPAIAKPGYSTKLWESGRHV